MEAKFHLALPCSSVRDTADFYVSNLEAKMGRNTDKWVDLDLYGNQLTFTAAGHFKFDYKSYKLNDQVLPSFHFGVIVDVDTWAKIYSKLLTENLDVTTEATFLENKIGEGAQAVVYRCRSRETGEPFAVKITRAKSEEIVMTIR